MGICVRAVAAHLELAPGDVVVTNHPGFGGSHLPDLTVVTPVHSPDGMRLGYVASRAHHAEIGGSRPGSMPPDATTLEEEGVVIPPTLLIERGEPRWERITDLLANARYPSRAPDDNLADLRAQVAANHRGQTLLRQLAASAGADTVARQMAAITSRAERSMRAALRRIPPGRYSATEFLDDGSPIVVDIEVAGDSAIFDFTGTADVHPGNLNATPAIVSSAVLYLLRLLVDEPLPLNEGLLRPVRIITPRSLLDPGFKGTPDNAPNAESGQSSPENETPTASERVSSAPPGANIDATSISALSSGKDPTGLPVQKDPTSLPAHQDPTSLPAHQDPSSLPAHQDPSSLPAVVGGNTEVSQRLVDTMIRALGIAACSQGTMNNVLWGSDRFGYYETIAGGEGASEGHRGASAVHTHMTNTRITDAEVLEARFPVRLDRFAIRRGSGGAGRWRGGDGVIREFTFLAPMSVSVLTQHRTAGPSGAAGGGAGLPGAQEVIRVDGTTVHLESIDGCEVAPGDRLRVATPGGGGWGETGDRVRGATPGGGSDELEGRWRDAMPHGDGRDGIPDGGGRDAMGDR
jgi:5-oxoprolinase (ATP-hydrolysing)